MSQRGLYIHVPFCEKKCHYCDFVIHIDKNHEHANDFLRAISSQSKYCSESLPQNNFDTLYFGGGTPSRLSLEETAQLFDILKRDFVWREGAEITFEMNPSDVTKEKIDLYRELGVNRISLGAQSFDNQLLKHMNRSHEAKQIFDSCEILQMGGIKNISIDLIIRLPNQTLKQVQNDLNHCVKLGVNQVVVYDLTVHRKTVYGNLELQDKLALPSEKIHEQMMSEVQRVLVKNQAYEHYELLSYALPGFESKHNLIYWANGEYLGLGPGAYSYLNKKRFMFAKNYQSYLKKCEAQNWMNDEEDNLSEKEIEMETFLVGLRLKQGVDLNQFSIIQNHLDSCVPKLEAGGLVKKIKSHLILTERGKYLAESVFEALAF